MSLAILFCDWEVWSLGCVTITKAKKEDFQHLSFPDRNVPAPALHG